MGGHRSTLVPKNRPFKGSVKKKTKKAATTVPKTKVYGSKHERVNAKGQAKKCKIDRSRAGVARSPPRLLTLIPFHPSADVLRLAKCVTGFLLSEAIAKGSITSEVAERLFLEASDAFVNGRAIPLPLPEWCGKGQDAHKVIEVLAVPHPTDADLNTDDDDDAYMQWQLRLLDFIKPADIVWGVFGEADMDNRGFSPFMDQLLTLMNKQGLPHIIGCRLSPINQPASADSWKICQRVFKTEFGAGHEMFDVDASVRSLSAAGFDPAKLNRSACTGLIHLLRHTLTMTLTPLSWRENLRGYIVARHIDIQDDVLRIGGIVRGRGFTTKYPVHITGVGDFPLTGIFSQTGDLLQGSFTETDTFKRIWDPLTAEVGEIGIDPEFRQVAEEDAASMNYDDDMREKEEPEFEDFDDDDDEWLNSLETESNADKMYGNMASRSLNEMELPDEVDTPNDVPARKRFSKYRGLRNFNNSPWDTTEFDEPEWYRQIFHLPSLRTELKALRKMAEASFDALSRAARPSKEGLYVTLTALIPPECKAALMAKLANRWPIIVSSLTTIERKLSVQHHTIQKFPQARDVPISSKCTLLLQNGFRRLLIRPVFSEGRKSADMLPVEVKDPSLHKMKATRYLSDSNRHSSLATFVGPTVNLKCPSIYWFLTQNPKRVEEVNERIQMSHAGIPSWWNPNKVKMREPARFEPIAFGTSLTTDPGRLVIKRILLTGYPRKINRKKCVIDRMFFNREDVEFYRPVLLSTKSGVVGKIKEPLGLKGEVKCVFDNTVQHSDTICMALYKRLLPPFHVEPSGCPW